MSLTPCESILCFEEWLFLYEMVFNTEALAKLNINKSSPLELSKVIVNPEIDNLKSAREYYNNIILLRSQKKIPLSISLTLSVVEFYVKKEEIIQNEKDIDRANDMLLNIAKVQTNEVFRKLSQIIDMNQQSKFAKSFAFILKKLGFKFSDTLAEARHYQAHKGDYNQATCELLLNYVITEIYYLYWKDQLETIYHYLEPKNYDQFKQTIVNTFGVDKKVCQNNWLEIYLMDKFKASIEISKQKISKKNRKNFNTSQDPNETDLTHQQFKNAIIPRSLAIDNYTQIIDMKKKIELYLDIQLNEDMKSEEYYFSKFDKLVRSFGSTQNMKTQILKLLQNKLLVIDTRDSNMMQDICEVIFYFFENFVKNKQNFSYCFENYVQNYYIKNLFILMDVENEHLQKLKNHVIENYRDILEKSTILKAHLKKLELKEKSQECGFKEDNIETHVQTNIIQPEMLRKRSLSENFNQDSKDLYANTKSHMTVKKFQGKQKLFSLGEKLMKYLYCN